MHNLSQMHCINKDKAHLYNKYKTLVISFRQSCPRNHGVCMLFWNGALNGLAKTVQKWALSQQQPCPLACVCW